MAAIDDANPNHLQELQHRVRGTLAMMRTIVRRSAEASTSLEAYVAHLDGRFAALAHVQNAALRNPTAGIDLELLVRNALADAEKRPAVTIKGATLMLHPRAAEPLALAIHELTTNSVKYGALSVATGRLAITWRIDQHTDRAEELIFEWTETEVNCPDEPRHIGFGMVVLREMLQYNLGARTKINFGNHGLRCEIIVPMTDRIISIVEPANDEL